MADLTVLGLDTSPTSTGWGKVWGGALVPAPEFGTVKPRITVPKTGDTLALSLRRMRRVFAELGTLVHDLDPDVIVIEGPSYHSTGSYWHENAGLWWQIVERIQRSGRPLVIVTPSTLKKFATGKGNAKKTDMCVAASYRFGLAAIGEDEADGLWLAAAGAQHYGWPVVKLPADQVAALDAVAWPTLDLSRDDETPVAAAVPL